MNYITYCVSFCFQAVELEYLKSDLIPMFINLAQDEQVLIIITRNMDGYNSFYFHINFIMNF